MNSPTQRSKKFLEQDGYTVANVEKWVAQVKQRFDAFGFGDLLACKPGEPIALIQTTTSSNMMARYHKIIGIRAAETWLQSGGAIFVHGWSKRGARGCRKLWACTVKEITLLELRAQKDSLLQQETAPDGAVPFVLVPDEVPF